MIAILYFMFKFRWSLIRTLEFINMRKPDTEVTKGAIRVLKELEKKIASRLLSQDPTKDLPLQMRLRFDWRVDDLNHGFTDVDIKKS